MSIKLLYNANVVSEGESVLFTETLGKVKHGSERKMLGAYIKHVESVVDWKLLFQQKLYLLNQFVYNMFLVRFS